MITKYDIQMVERKRQRELEDEYLRLLGDKSPEGVARLNQIGEELDRVKEIKQQQLEQALAISDAQRKQDEQFCQQIFNKVQNGSVLQRFGDYRKLYFYGKSKVIYDLTFHFCDRFITEYHDRTKDQMVQAARSGKQNFVEGMQDGQADIEKALFLMTIGQGSLQELLEDYEDYLRTRHLTKWTTSHSRYNAMVEYCKTRNDIEDYEDLFVKMNDEELANMALTLIHQTDYLLDRFLKKIEQEFVATGGSKEIYKKIREIAQGKLWDIRRYRRY